MLSILLLALPVPLIDLGEGDLDQVRQVLDLLVGPVRVSEVTQFETSPLSLVESNPGFLHDWRSSLLLGHMLLDERQGLESRKSLQGLATYLEYIPLLIISVAHGLDQLLLLS